MLRKDQSVVSGIKLEFKFCESEGTRIDSSHSSGFVRVDFLQKGFSSSVIHCNYTVYRMSSPSVKKCFS